MLSMQTGKPTTEGSVKSKTNFFITEPWELKYIYSSVCVCACVLFLANQGEKHPSEVVRTDILLEECPHFNGLKLNAILTL